jgi:molecular chaperone DnaK
VKGLLLLDVTPLSLGIETLGGVFTKIIERNTTIPTKKSQVFSTAGDGQTQVEVNVLQGEREMAQYNKQLGKFQLDGIPPAPRGVPQIEVTFDIDANGIVHVSAKDLGTGREQHVTITASTNLNEEEIKKAVREAEQFAGEDKKRKEEVDTKNAADSAVYQAEKTLKDVGDKIDAADKEKVQRAIDKLKGSISANSVEGMKTDTEALQKEFFEVSEKLYKQNPGAGQGQGQGPDAGQQDGGEPEGGFKDAGGDAK